MSQCKNICHAENTEIQITETGQYVVDNLHPDCLKTFKEWVEGLENKKQSNVLTILNGLKEKNNQSFHVIFSYNNKNQTIETRIISLGAYKYEEKGKRSKLNLKALPESSLTGSIGQNLSKIIKLPGSQTQKVVGIKTEDIKTNSLTNFQLTIKNKIKFQKIRIL